MLIAWAAVGLMTNGSWIVQQAGRFRRFEPEGAEAIDWSSPLRLQRVRSE